MLLNLLWPLSVTMLSSPEGAKEQNENTKWGEVFVL